MKIELQSYLKTRKELIEKELNRRIPPEQNYPEKIHRAVRYSLFSGGKRVRPILLMASYEIFRDDLDRALPFACAVEMLHTYSLIHDDLPAMDDDDFRRGKPSSHKKFGEATAILAGDALLTEAFGLMAKAGYELGLGSAALSAMSELGRAAGLGGLISGQEADLESEGRDYEEKDLEYISRHKTGSLIRAAVVMGGILAEAPESDLTALSGFGERIGMAFQIVDDMLDFQGGDGKEKGSDARKKKATYAALLGLKGSEERARRLSEEGLSCLEIFSGRAEVLREIARYLVARKG